MKPALLVIISFLLVISLPLHAQTDTTKAFGSYLIMPIEFPSVDASAMDQQLGANGFPGMKYPKAALGIGLKLYTNRIITTLAFNQGTRKNDNDLFRHEVEYSSTSFNIGYDMLRHYQFSLYPYVGYKGCGLKYLYQEKPQEVWTVEDYLQANSNSKEITNSLANLDLGLGWSFQTFYLLNLKAGYLVPLEKAKWKINNNTDLLRHAPGIAYKFYFVVSVGLGNIQKDKPKKEQNVLHELKQEALLKI